MGVAELGPLPHEWHLARWWLGAGGRRLQDATGRALVVLHPGWMAGTAGPDFRDAVLRVDGELLRGDVELHVRASDWVAHGHQRDPAYNGVLLHAVWLDDAPGGVPREDGHTVPAVELHGLACELLEWSAGLAEPCRGLAALWGDQELAACLDELGRARFEEKVTAFVSQLEAGADPAQVLYSGVLEALGYSANRRSFRQLAAAVPLSLAEAVLSEGQSFDAAAAQGEGEERLRGLLMGAAGLLPSQRRLGAGLDLAGALEAARLEQHWHALHMRLAAMPLVAGAWRLSGVRPANAPPRRITAAAALLARAQPEGLAIRLCNCLTADTGTPAHAARQVHGLLTVPATGFWAQRADFTHQQHGRGQALSSSQSKAALIGPARAAEIAVNIALPWAAAVGDVQGDSRLAAQARRVYEAWPDLAENAIAATMRRLWSEQGATLPLRSARRHQALLHVWRHWCAEKRCTRCPIGAQLLAQGLAVDITG